MKPSEAVFELMRHMAPLGVGTNDGTKALLKVNALIRYLDILAEPNERAPGSIVGSLKDGTPVFYGKAPT
jgi:hypothetical protein